MVGIRRTFFFAFEVKSRTADSYNIKELPLLKPLVHITYYVEIENCMMGNKHIKSNACFELLIVYLIMDTDLGTI